MNRYFDKYSPDQKSNRSSWTFPPTEVQHITVDLDGTGTRLLKQKIEGISFSNVFDNPI